MHTENEDTWNVFVIAVEKILDNWKLLDKSRTYVTDMEDNLYSKVDYTAYIPLINKLSATQCEKLKIIIKNLNEDPDQTTKFDYETTNVNKLWLKLF